MQQNTSIVSAWLMFAWLITISFTTYAGEPGARPTSTTKAAPAGNTERGKAPFKPAKPPLAGAPANIAGAEAPQPEAAGSAAEAAANDPEPTLVLTQTVAAEPSQSGQTTPGPSWIEQLESTMDLGVLLGGAALLLLLTAAGACLFVQRRAGNKRVTDELHTVHTRLEQLAQRVVALEHLAPLSASSAAAASPTLAPARRRRRSPIVVQPAPASVSCAIGVEQLLLQKLINALDSHGEVTAAGTHLEVELQLLAPARAMTDIAAELSQLNFMPATAHDKDLRGQNFLSIVPTRSREDNLPRQVVRVDKQALSALRAVAFPDVETPQ